jgi:hypothetical protein
MIHPPWSTPQLEGDYDKVRRRTRWIGEAWKARFPAEGSAFHAVDFCR